MFTGLTETLGTVSRATNKGAGITLTIKADTKFDDVKIGDSISVDGVCLTVETFTDTEFKFFAMSETINNTTLKNIKDGARVNLEQALKVGSRMGGHFVSGHVDAVGKIIADKKVGDSLERTISIDKSLMHYLAKKGSVTIDGISLTIANLSDNAFTLALIPHTLSATNIGFKKIGDAVNVETDILAKYTERILNKKTGLTLENLTEMGF